MKNKSKKYVMKWNYVSQKEISEIDLDLKKDLKIDEDNEKIAQIFSENDEFYSTGESCAININKVIKALENLRDKHECKYVEIMYHVDHIGYIFTGLNIDVYNEDTQEYKNYIEKESAKKLKEEKIKQLQNIIDELKNN